MKYVSLWSKTEEPKKDQAMLVRLYADFFIFTIFIFGTFAIYLQIAGEKMTAYSHWYFMFFLMIIVHIISMAPNILRYSWKQIIIIPSLSGTALGIFLGGILRFLL